MRPIGLSHPLLYSQWSPTTFVGLAVNSVCLCVARYLEGGVERALSGGARSGRPREIDEPRLRPVCLFASPYSDPIKPKAF